MRNTGLNVIVIPYQPEQTGSSAKGIYINYLEIGNLVFLPIFKIKEDQEAIKRFEEIFPGKTIVSVDSREIAKEGGILNCISWNILK